MFRRAAVRSHQSYATARHHLLVGSNKKPRSSNLLLQNRATVPIHIRSLSTINKNTNNNDVVEKKKTDKKRLKSTQPILHEEADELFTASKATATSTSTAPFKKVLAANRGEIATRIMRACSELNIASAGIYSHEDRFTQHRYKADQAFELSCDKSPVAAYLDIDTIVKICKEQGIEAVHPGYGFLSENEHFAAALQRAGIKFIGPTIENLRQFGDKTSAKEIAIRMNVPVIAGSDNAFANWQEVRDWIAENTTYPVIVKAAMGGGGRGIRVVPSESDLEGQFILASNEAKNAFGDGRCFVEKYVERPRHIEVQCLGDGKGNVVHIWDRDCSVQRRHQKVVETAPAMDLPPVTRQNMLDDACRLLAFAKYRNAGTVEFLVDKNGQHYFMEVNPRVQVEHTVTEEISGIDIVQSQIKIASGATLEELGLTQDQIPEPHCIAMQCRVTTEDPSQDFRPDTGTIDVFRMPAGMGIRLDDGPGFVSVLFFMLTFITYFILYT